MAISRMGWSSIVGVEFSSVCTPRTTQVGFLLRGPPSLGFSSGTTRVFVRASKSGGSKKSSRGLVKAATKRKENPWNDAIEEPIRTNSRKSSSRARPSSSSSAPRPRRSSKSEAKSSRAPANERYAPAIERRPPGDDACPLVSAIMPVEIEKVLQAGEPAATPSWQTFASSLCGVWRGFGAAFSPATAEMEAIALGKQDEMLYDCRILSTVEECKGTSMSKIQRKTVWAVGNPLGEQGKGRIQVQEQFVLPQNITDDEHSGELTDDEDDKILRIEDFGVELAVESTLNEVSATEQSSGKNSSSQTVTTDLESPDLVYDTVMEEDVLELEPGLVFFEDGSYSRGPLTLLDEDSSEVTTPSYKIEQCIVRGGHSRLRLVHTIAVEGGGESVELLRVAVYIEEWMGPSNMKSISDSGGHHLKLFSQQLRLKPQELVGTWKVFELSATAILADHMEARQPKRPPYVYMTTETQKRRLSPEIPIHFADEDIMDIQDVTVMWLPGGISAYVDVKEDGTLTVGVGWYNDGINLVMERDYNTDGNLSEVHYKSEVKGGWIGGRM